RDGRVERTSIPALYRIKLEVGAERAERGSGQEGRSGEEGCGDGVGGRCCGNGVRMGPQSRYKVRRLVCMGVAADVSSFRMNLWMNFIGPASSASFNPSRQWTV